MPDEGQSQFTIADQRGFVNLSSAGGNGGVANQAGELPGPTT